MSLTSYRAAPPRGTEEYMEHGGREFADTNVARSLIGLAATYSPVP